MFSTLAIVWRIASPYFYSEDRWAGRILLAAVVAIELSIVGLNVLLNSWNNAFYNALQDKDWDAFVYQLGYFCVLATAFILLAVYQLYLNQWLQIRWRRWLTQAPTTTACNCSAMLPTIPTNASPKTSGNLSTPEFFRSV
jgi:putative ATP-binding cassette transporter